MSRNLTARFVTPDMKLRLTALRHAYSVDEYASKGSDLTQFAATVAYVKTILSEYTFEGASLSII